ncbi:MAG: BT_3928 family protein [Moheibacter sp.]
MKYIVQLSRISVGIIFIISGFVKVVDPIGFGYKLEEYFAPSVFDISFLHDLALPQATFFSIFEILLGIFLLLGVFKKFTKWSLLLLIIFFTFLTFYSAYFNKVTDCGCFGDALKLTPWQSFWKDIFLLILILIIFIGQKYIHPLFKNSKLNLGISIIALLITSWIAYIGIQYLPIIDFRAYAKGKNLVEGMKSAEELGLEPPKQEVIYTLKNKNSDETVKITDTEYLSEEKWYEEGTPWEFLPDLTETRVISAGYEPPIHDFILDCEGEDLTEFYLGESKVAFFITPFSNKVTTENINELNELYTTLSKQGVKVVGLTNGDLENTLFPYCYVDQITLKTMIRRNPGVMTISNGTVMGKFHNHPLPKAEIILETFQK